MYHEDQDHLTLSLCLSNAKPHNKHFSYAVWNRLVWNEGETFCDIELCPVGSNWESEKGNYFFYSFFMDYVVNYLDPTTY